MAEFGNITGGGSKSFGSKSFGGFDEGGGFVDLACMLFWIITFEQGLQKDFKEYGFIGDKEAWRTTFDYLYFCGRPNDTYKLAYRDHFDAALKSKCWDLKRLRLGGNRATCKCGPRIARLYPDFQSSYSHSDVHRRSSKEHVEWSADGIRFLGCCAAGKGGGSFEDREVIFGLASKPGKKWTSKEVKAYFDAAIAGKIDGVAAKKECKKLKLT